MTISGWGLPLKKAEEVKAICAARHRAAKARRRSMAHRRGNDFALTSRAPRL
jgi:hypothetical protein